MANAVRPTTPTFNCDQRTFSRSGILHPLLHELRYVWIGRRFQPVLVTLKNQPAFAQDHKFGARAPACPVWSRLESSLFRIVAEIRDKIAVLITMRHHQRGCVTEITFLNK